MSTISSRKRKTPAGRKPTPPSESRRKTRASGPAEIEIPLYPDDRPSLERPAKQRRLNRIASRTKIAPIKKKSNLKRDKGPSSISAPADDGISDELHILPSVPPRGVGPSSEGAFNETPVRSPASSTAQRSVGSRLFLEAVEITSPKRPVNSSPRRDPTSPRRPAKSPSLQARGSPPPKPVTRRFGRGDESQHELRKRRRMLEREISEGNDEHSSNTSLAIDTPGDSMDEGPPDQRSRPLALQGKTKAIELESSEGDDNYITEPFESTGPEDNFEANGPQLNQSRMKTTMSAVQSSPTKTQGPLSPHHHPFLKAQKIAILRSLQVPPVVDPAKSKEAMTTAASSVATLTTLLRGTTERGEGNSCLIWGHRGSGKSRVVNQALANVSSFNPIVVRLTAEAQHNDRLAMREMARQLMRQTGTSFALPDDSLEVDGPTALNLSANAVPNAHLPAMISTLTTLPRPTIVVLEAFDLFAGHARQALLYCLLDTTQSCHAHTSGGASTSSNPGAGGIAVIGVTTRNDCLNLLEKRVKSRFSGRSIRVGPPNTMEEYVAVLQSILRTPTLDSQRTGEDEELDDDNAMLLKEWGLIWETAIQKFVSDKEVLKVLRDIFTTTRDVRTLTRILIDPLLALSPNSPWLSARILRDSYANQMPRSQYQFLPNLSYACLSLLIASHHVSNKGHDVFNFEMLWLNFSRQVDRTASMPVVLDGASVGMIKVPRSIMFSAFETLIELGIFEPVGPPSVNVAKQFIKYRCDVDRVEILDAVDRAGNLKLKAWLRRAAE
ncbi:hypothetical protein FRB95_014352 [Tulasnella sp. JGI-2019a]|nr:hypothetical protein FRB95_014352 [Tulasnella sp. JGI-2019a]